MFAEAHPKVIVRNRKKVSIEKRDHRINITESSSDKFPTWIFNLGPYGQLRAVRGNSSITHILFYKQRFISNDFLTSLIFEKKNKQRTM